MSNKSFRRIVIGGRIMIEDKKIEKLISIGVKSITISKERYENLSQETKNLIKLNNIELKFMEDK